MNLDNKRFIFLENKSGLSSNETVFHYFQDGERITGTYKGGAIAEGFIVGKQTGEHTIELLFQCLTVERELKAGQSKGVVSVNAQGKLQLNFNFNWNWLTGDLSSGVSGYVEEG